MKRFTIQAMLAVLSLGAAQAADIFVPGYLKYEFWSGGVVKAAVESGAAGAPQTNPAYPFNYLSTFECPTDFANNYSQRVSGFFVPAVSGNYQFNISADDTADLFLSTDDTSAKKRMICQQPGWNATRDWTTDRGGNIAQRISATWVDPTGATPFASGIPLVAGSHYYIEGVMNEFGGGDNFAVRYGLITEAAPWADGDPSNLRSNLIGVIGPAPTTLTITVQPQNATNFAGQSARFTVASQTDSVFPATYQWRKGGTNIAGATTTAYSLVASAGDNGASFDCVVQVPGISKTSSAATLTVRTTGGVLVTGKLKHEFFSGQTRQAVESGNGGVPTFVNEFTSFEAPVNFADNFARRVSGYFTPATSGNYVFFVSSDDDSDLFLSTDDTPSKKRVIAQEASWSNNRSWNTPGGGASTAGQKRSDQWSPDGVTTPFSTGIPLVAGTKYYIEGVQHEGGGGDDFSATFKLLADPDPADNDATKLTSGLISYITSPVTTGTITGQPQNVTVFESQPFSLSVTVQTDSEFTPVYQWRKAGVNIAGATGASYNVSPASLSDTGSYDCVVTIPNFAGTLTSSAATVTVNLTPFATGFLKYEYFPNKLRTDVEAGNGGNPYFAGNTIGSDKSGGATIWETGVNFADNYANRFSGFFIPPSTADYTFFVSGDDDTDLFLSTDDKPANKRLIAQVPTWTNSRAWLTTPQQRSDQWMDATGATPWAAGFHLLAGTHYYIEGVHHEGGGGDDFAATYIVLGDADPAVGDAPKLTGGVIGVQVPPQPLTITQEPQSVTNQESTTATFTVGATTTGFYPPTYQWKKSNVNIPGATSASYTTPLLTRGDNNSQFMCVVSILGTNPTNSQTATLTVVNDTTPPVILGAGTVSFDHVGIKFDGLIDPVTGADKSKYTVSGATVGAAAVNYDGVSVTLTVSGLASGPFTVTVNGVKDIAGNPLNGGTVNGHIESGLINQDVDTAGAGAEPGYATSPAAGEFYITAGGSDMWGNADQFHFVGTQVASDFDKRVRVENLEPVNRWSKAGLCVRENLDNTAAGGTGIGGAINLDIYAMPLAVQTQDDPGNPTGQNGIEAGFRGVADGATGGWPITTRGAQINPSYLPNAWVRLKGVGHTNYNAYYSTNGNDWILHSSAIMNPPLINQYVGIVLTAHDNNPGFLADAHFLNYSDVSSAPRISPVVLIGGSFTLSWTGSGTLQQTDSLTSPNWQPAAIQTNPQTITPAATGTRFYRIFSP